MSSGGGSSPSGSTQTVQRADPWSGQQPYLTGGQINSRPATPGEGQEFVPGIFPEAQKLFLSGGPQYYGGQTYAGATDAMTQALQRQIQQASGGNPLTGAATGAAQNILNPNYLTANAGNPYFQSLAGAGFQNPTQGLLSNIYGAAAPGGQAITPSWLTPGADNNFANFTEAGASKEQRDQLARQLGYTGDFGGGAFAAWRAAHPDQDNTFQDALGALKGGRGWDQIISDLNAKTPGSPATSLFADLDRRGQNAPSTPMFQTIFNNAQNNPSAGLFGQLAASGQNAPSNSIFSNIANSSQANPGNALYDGLADGPALQSAMTSAMQRAMPNLLDTFTQGNRLNSPGAAFAISQGLGDAAAPYAFQGQQAAAQGRSQNYLSGLSAAQQAGQGLTQNFGLGLNALGQGAQGIASNYATGLNAQDAAARGLTQNFGLGLGATGQAASGMQQGYLGGLSAQQQAADSMSRNYQTGLLGLAQAGQGLSQNFSNAGSQQNQAGLLAPQLAQMPYQDIQQLYSAGAQQQGLNQNVINDAMTRYNYNQTLPYNLLNYYGGALQGNYGGTSSLESPYFAQSGGGGGIGGALGGAASGAALGSMFGPWGTGIGAVGGGLLGAFF